MKMSESMVNLFFENILIAIGIDVCSSQQQNIKICIENKLKVLALFIDVIIIGLL